MSTCNYCRTEGLTWAHVEGDKYRLVDAIGIMHKCQEAQAVARRLRHNLSQRKAAMATTSNTRTYIGDGVYAEFNGMELHLTAGGNRLVLDHGMVIKLRDWYANGCPDYSTGQPHINLVNIGKSG